jgi:membrane protein implicated in regulation of membrane protease activity
MIFIKLSALLFFALVIGIAAIVIGRLSKLLVFDLRTIVVSAVLVILALIYLYWKSRPA